MPKYHDGMEYRIENGFIVLRPKDDGVITYDDLIKDQDAAIAELLDTDIDKRCMNCGEDVPVPLELFEAYPNLEVCCDDCITEVLSYRGDTS